MTRKLDVLQRFIHVVAPLSKVYDLPMSALHIFFDTAGGLIAFNRNGSLFLNLRYFEAWRKSLPLCPFPTDLFFPQDGEDVKKGYLSQAQISWQVLLATILHCNLLHYSTGSSLSHMRSPIIL